MSHLEDAYNRHKGEIPDGVVDASDYIDVVKTIVNSLSHLDNDDTSENIKFMTTIMDVFMSEDLEVDIDKIMETITAMAFVVTTTMQFANGLDDEFVSKYINSMNDNVLPVMEKEARAIPYWNE